MEMLNLPPHSIEAEQAVLGALMVLDSNEHKALEVTDTLRAEMFYNATHQEIYRAMIKLKERDLITITDALDAQGKLEECGGFAYIAELGKSTPSTSIINTYAEIISDKYHAREIIGIANNAAQQAYNKEPNQEIIQALGDSIQKIDLSGGYEPNHIGGMAEDFINRLEARSKGERSAVGLKTGIDRLDDEIIGVGEDWLITLFARPSHGKTLVAQIISNNVGQRESVQFFSMEMSKEEIMDRFVGVSAGIPPKLLKTGELNEYQYERVSRVLGAMVNGQTNIYYDETPALSLAQIRHRVKTTIKKKGKQSLIVIDYLKLMSLPKADREDLAIGEVTRGLKQLAKEIKTPVLLLAQANRGTDKEKRPQMSNIYGSSAIEADSDLILAVHREEIVNEHTALRGVVEIIPVKFRHGDLPRPIYMKAGENGLFRCLSDIEIGEVMNQEEMRGNNKKPFEFK
jgi:replicative DNA helicase